MAANTPSRSERLAPVTQGLRRTAEGRPTRHTDPAQAAGAGLTGPGRRLAAAARAQNRKIGHDVQSASVSRTSANNRQAQSKVSSSFRHLPSTESSTTDVDLGRLGLQPVACGLAHPLRPQRLVAGGQDERAGSDATCCLIPASSFLTVASLVSASRYSVYPVGIHGAGASAVRAPKSAR